MSFSTALTLDAASVSPHPADVASTVRRVAPGVGPVLAAFLALLAVVVRLPVATAPNSVVFASGLIATQRMAREGLLLDLLAAGVIALVCWGMIDR